MRNSRAGISLVEIIIVITMVGLMAGIMVPRFRMSPKQKLRAAAQVVAYDLELARTRALSTRSLVRVNFDATNRQRTRQQRDRQDDRQSSERVTQRRNEPRWRSVSATA